jgi:hypothetical protein
MHQPLFEDLVLEVAGGKRSFEEWTRSLKKHQKHLFYAAANQWVEYLLRCERTLQLFRPRSSAEPAAEPTAAAVEAERPAAAAVSAAGTAAGAAAARQGLKANLPAAASSLRRPLSKKAKQQQQQPGLKQATLFMFNTVDAMGQQRSASAAREGSSSMAAGTAAATAAAAAGEAGVSGVVSPTQRGSSVQPDTAAADAVGSFQPAAAQATAASSVAGAAGDGSLAAALETADQFAGFGAFDNSEGWCGNVPSTASVIGLFLKCSTTDVAVAVFKQLRVGGTIWKGDHNYKFTKCVRSNGQTVFAAAFTIINVSNWRICCCQHHIA